MAVIVCGDGEYGTTSAVLEERKEGRRYVTVMKFARNEICKKDECEGDGEERRSVTEK